MRKRKNGIKSDGPQITFDLVFSTAVKIVVAFAIVMVFVRNVVPFQKEAVVLDSVSAPESSAASSVSSSNSTSDVTSSPSGVEQSSAPESANSVNSENSESPESVSRVASASVPQVSDEPKTASSKININTASIEQLKTLNGIGDVKAKAIVEYREKNGGFKSVDELDNVDGIGKATLDKLRDQITV